MPYNGSGTFAVSYTYTVETLTAAKLNASLTDISTGLTNCLTKDGQSTMTAPIKASAGSASAPSYTFGTDTNSGFYSAGADTVGGAVNGAVVFTFTTAGIVLATGKTLTLPSGGGGVIPSGGIIMWSGTIATIPSGWYLCDGDNGTPDLRNVFVIGAHSDDAGAAKTTVTGSALASGGSKDAINVSHTHTATVTDAGHTHTTTLEYDTSIAGGGARSAYVRGTGSPNDAKTSSSATTGVTVANSTEGSSGTNANLPPYYALAYIMKA